MRCLWPVLVFSQRLGGKVRSPVPGTPILSSADTGWEGFALEQHSTPPFLESPRNIKFPGHLIVLNLSEEPPLVVYRALNGRKGRDRRPNGSLSLFPVQSELVECEQYGASTAFPLLIHDSTMARVCEESRGARQVELILHSAVEDQILRNLISTLAEDLRAGCPAGRIFGESVVNAIAAYAAAKYSVFPSSFPEYRDGLSADRLRSVVEYINANLASNLGVAEIARVVFISPYHFAKLFKRSTGQTLHQYVLERRIRKARSLLAMSNLSLAEIGYLVGLANQSHFTTVFRRKIGVTPGSYRSQVRARAPQ